MLAWCSEALIISSSAKQRMFMKVILSCRFEIVQMVSKSALWMVSGFTALAGAAAYVYFRTRKSVDKVSKGSEQEKSSASNKLRGLKRITRERKMVFVVNRPLLSNKQMLFISVSTACVRYYQSVRNKTEYYDTHVQPWTRSGQMKVVLKANSGEELQSILERCQKEGIEALILNVADFVQTENENPSEKKRPRQKKKTENGSFANKDPMTPVILCVLAPTNQLDQITGHLKLL